MTKTISAIKDKWQRFLNEHKSFFMVAGVCILGLVIGSKPIAFGILLGASVVLVLLFCYPELGLLLFITFIPFHIIMVKLFKIAPGMWKECLLALTVILWLTKGIAKQKLSITRTKVNLPFYLFVFWCFLLLLVDINNFNKNIMGLRNLLQYSLVFIIAVNLIKDKSSIKKYILLILLIAVAIALTVSSLFLFKRETLNLANNIVNPEFPLTYALKHSDRRMIPFIFMGAEYYAYYMSIICCLLTGFLLFAKSKLLKVIIVIGMCLTVFSLLLTHTRGGVSSLLLAVIFFATRYNKKLLFSTIILSFIVAMFLPASMYDRLVTGFFKYRASDRLFMISNALIVASTSPVWGIGLGNVGAAAAEANELSTPHNYYCYLALQTGYVGLTIYLWVMLTFFKTALKVYERIEERYFKGLMAGMVMFFIAFSASAFFVGSGEAYILAPFYWLSGGLVMILDKVTKKESIKQ